MSQRMNYNAVSPAGMKGLGAVYGYVRQSGLPSRLIDLVFLRVSQINGCAYCIDSHSRDLLKAGLPVEHLVLVAVWPEAGNIFDEQERAALAWAEVVSRLGDRGVPDSAFGAAAAVFDEKRLQHRGRPPCSIAWVEYQARSDLISFYKFDPVKLVRFYGDPRRGKPLMRRVWIQDMLTPRTYWRIRARFMRVHHQFVMANERRSTYDYFMLVCGPIPFARCTLAPTGPVELIASDGAFIDQPASPVLESCASNASSG